MECIRQVVGPCEVHVATHVSTKQKKWSLVAQRFNYDRFGECATRIENSYKNVVTISAPLNNLLKRTVSDSIEKLTNDQQ